MNFASYASQNSILKCIYCSIAPKTPKPARTALAHLRTLVHFPPYQSHFLPKEPQSCLSNSHDTGDRV